MKRTLLLTTLVGAFITAFGQNDTIFYLDFESGLMPSNFVDTQDTARHYRLAELQPGQHSCGQWIGQ